MLLSIHIESDGGVRKQKENRGPVPVVCLRCSAVHLIFFLDKDYVYYSHLPMPIADLI